VIKAKGSFVIENNLNNRLLLILFDNSTCSLFRNKIYPFLSEIKLDKNNVSDQITIPKVIEKPLIFYQMYFFSLFLAIWTKFRLNPLYLE